MDNFDWLRTFQKYYDFKFIKNKDKFYINPIYVGFKLTEMCNQKCVHCWAGKSNVNFNYDSVIEAIEKIAYFKPYMIGISGGEPFIRMDIFDILKYCVSKFSIIEILTNGVLLSNEKVLRLKSILRNTDAIHFSLDGIEKSYNIQRGVNHYEKAIKNLELLVKNNLNIKVHMTVTSINVNDMIEVYNAVCKLGINKFSVNYVYPLRKGKQFFKSENNIEVMEKYYENVMTIKKLNMTRKVDFTYFLPLEVQRNNIFFHDVKDEYSKNILNFDILHWTIDADGNIFNFMDYYSYEELKIGNIFKDDLEFLIENNSKIQKKILFRNLYNDKCSKCNLLHLCRGGEFINSYPDLCTKDKRCLIEKRR